MEVKQIDLGTSVEFSLSTEKDPLTAGFVQIGDKALTFRKESDGTIRKLEIASIDALKLEAHYFVLLRHSEGKEAKLRFGLADSARAFGELLGDKIRLLQGSGRESQSASEEEAMPASGKPRIRFKTMGFRSFSSVEVTSPVEVSASGESYVVYAVRSRVRMHAQEEDSEWVVYHRYSDFERFDQQLRGLVSEQLEAASLLLPVLPPKPWIPAAQTSRDFVESRARKLGRYVGAVVGTPELLGKVAYLEHVLGFLSEGEHWTREGEVGQTSLLQRGIVSVNHGLSRMLDTRDPNTPEQDYEYVLSLFRKQGLSMQKFTWDKLVMAVFGTTSAGKSSLVNHLLTVSCAASSMAGQVDVGFSFFEVLSEPDFCRYSSETRFPDFSPAQLKAPLKPADQNLCGDPRYGFVFVYLSAEETLERYAEQLKEDQGVLRKFSKVRAVLVNERYLQGSKAERELAKKMILIDSKGMDASTFNNGDDSVWSEVKASQYIAKISHLNLFLMPANDIRNAEPSLSVFELAVVCSEEGIQFLKQQRRQRERSSAGPASSGVGATSPTSPTAGGGASAAGGADPFAGLLSRMLGVDQLFGAVSRVAGSIASYVVPPKSAQAIDAGTARWQKTFFVLSRADEVLRGDAGAAGQLFYELGVAFGRRLNYLESPTFARIALLGLPEKQGAGEEPLTGFLADFKRYLGRQAVDSSYDHSRDDAIILMCEQLEQAMKSGWVSSAYFRFQKQYIRTAKQSALNRRLAVKEK